MQRHPRFESTLLMLKSRTTVAAAVGEQGKALYPDARIDNLLAEHRQNGGMSALQNPQFHPQATYESEGR